VITRKSYIRKLDDFREKQLIKVITGVRRCGKSTLLEMYRNKLIEEGVPDSRITFINFDEYENEPLLDPDKLHAELLVRLAGKGMNYIFLDEVQRVEKFEKVISSVFTKRNVDIYITGSNASMLSGELATLLSGRYIQIRMLPLSFCEYVSAYPGENDRMGLFAEYQILSSFPYTQDLDRSASKAREYLAGLYDTILLRDVAQRRGMTDTGTLDRLARYMLSNISNITSSKKISDTMTSFGRKISVPTVESYLSSLADAYLFYKAKRYDIKGKQLLVTNDKYYVVDIGLRNAVLGGMVYDTSHALENIIFLELVGRGYDVYVGKAGEFEVDFVAMRHGIPTYFQVCETLRDPAVLEREIRPLRAIADNNPKYVLTMDIAPEANIEGILKQNAVDFLLSSAEDVAVGLQV
jgi:predicted AAA+ superfamily ATPase